MAYIGNKSRIAVYDSYTRDQVDAKIDAINLYDFEYTALDQNDTLLPDTRYAVDFTAGPLTLSLPVTPDNGSRILILVDDGDPTGSTISRNGETIMGLSEDLTIDFGMTSVELVYIDSDWRII